MTGQPSASDVQDALAAMIAAKRALEAAYARPVLIIDLMRAIDWLEAQQHGKPERETKVKCESTGLPDRQRLIDLVRYMRHQLHNDGLITDEEYSALAKEIGAVERLESYDSATAAVRRESLENTARLVDAFADLMRLTEHICQKTGYPAKLDMHHAALDAARGAK